MFMYEIARAVAICVIRDRDAPSPSRRFRVTATSHTRVRARTPSNPSGRNCLCSSARRVGLERARVRSTSSQSPSLVCRVDTKRALDASTSRHSTARRDESAQMTFCIVPTPSQVRDGASVASEEVCAHQCVQPKTRRREQETHRRRRALLALRAGRARTIQCHTRRVAVVALRSRGRERVDGHGL